ncbi:MAG TPA: c-type cytochrome [Acidiferrobacterales bacterium]
MSDREFLKTFSGLIAALLALTVIIFILAQMVVSGSGLKKDKLAANDEGAVASRIKPVGEVNRGSPVMNSLIPSANAAAADGKATYDTACMACHAAGVAGAPKLGDKGAWGPRIAQGKDTLYKHAIGGFQGKAGFMPAKGGNASLPDDAVKAAVDYMVSQSK